MHQFNLQSPYCSPDSIKSTSAEGERIQAHGTIVDARRQRVQCRYCQKEVSGYNRLKHHLGDVGKDVTACTKVPPHVKAHMRGLLLGKKKKLHKEVSQVEEQHQLSLTHSATLKNVKIEETSLEENTGGCPGPEPTNTKIQGKRTRDSEPYLSKCQNLPAPHLASNNNAFTKVEANDGTTFHAERCIGNFFFDAGIDPVLIKLPSFQTMMDAVIGCGSGYKAPRYDELRGRVLQHELSEVNRRVEEIKRSWAQTGCSVMLDGWTDKGGRKLIIFLASCPQGTIFLRSMDATDAMNNADSLFVLIAEVINEVGPQNVIQVVAHDTSDIVENAGKKTMKAFGSIIWTFCADHSINLILEKIETMSYVKKVLNNAKMLTRFIYGNELTFELSKRYISGRDIIKSSNFKSVASFITMQNMVSEKENLIHMFSSAAWLNSNLAFETKGKYITKLVKDYQFWNSCIDVLNITNPLVGILHRISRVDEPPMGFLYDAMDRSKEEIKKNVAEEQSKFEPVWEIIDNIWNNELHSPLHAAGYYLNPRLCYSSDFCLDNEVSIGIMYCNVRMVEDKQDQENIVIQINEYKEKRGGFDKNMTGDQLACISPETWWSMHGSQYPELQRWAIRILSQTCSSATRHMLRSEISEQLHLKTLNCLERQRLRDIEFVSNNRRLWQTQSGCNIEAMFCHEKLDFTDDWIIED